VNTTSDSPHALTDPQIADRALTRRALLGRAAAAGAAVLVAGATVKLGSASAQDVSAQNHTSQRYTVSASANFRSGPSTSYSIISVISKGATFTLNGRTQNGYAAITYQSRSGWVLASLVVAAGTSPDPVITGTAWTTAAVNLRSGPSTSNQVLRVVPSGARIGVSNTVRSGFRYVSYQGQAGWMFDAYISFSDGTNQPETFTTTAALNLRAEPSTSAKILLVMPEGATVQAAKGTAPGFRQVIYKGTTGWAATAYLN
jgi:uncharacterized protein YgiM (DUF1202 family)